MASENALSRKAISVDVPELIRRGVDVSFDPVDPIPQGAATVEFPDQALDRAIRRALHKGEGWRIGASEVGNLKGLALAGLGIEDLTGLEVATGLLRLDLSNNRVEDLVPLAGLTSLEGLWLSGNPVSDISPIGGLSALKSLALDNTKVDGLAPIAGMRGLISLALDGNSLRDVSPLGGNVGLHNLSLSDNEISEIGVLANMPDLRWLSLNGNRISSLEPLEVLSHVRTEDGLVTAMHDVAADSVLPFFNPGANTRQRSVLRVVNTEAGPAKWLTGGHDDNGVWWAMPNAVLVPPGHGLTATVQALEEEHGLGDGAGKWRLRVPRWPWLAMSLLESPTGHLTNLSTAPANVERLANGMARHRLPLFLAAGGSRESFARVVNHSPQAGEVEIEGIDDAGNLLGPVRLSIPGRKTVHFNSHDLQNGNAAKGLSGGLGAGDVDWRLALTTALDLQVLSYVRTADGFVTAMHDLAPVAEDGGHRVVFFNPGSNTAQVSRLRLMNNGDEAAQVTITGIDDEGMPSGTVALTLAGRSALTLTAAQLEAGGDGLSGRLGDGTGKWRLRVHSDAPLAVMSLLESPTGHLTNLSTATAKIERNPWPVSASPQARPLAREGRGTNYAVDFGKGGD